MTELKSGFSFNFANSSEALRNFDSFLINWPEFHVSQSSEHVVILITKYWLSSLSKERDYLKN